MAKVSSNAEINSLRLKEQASAPDTPASGYFQVYAKSDGKLYYKDDAGVENCINPMTTAGDIIIGGANGAPARVAAGTETQVLTMGATAPEWAEATGGGSSGDYPYQVMIPFSKPSASSGTVTVSADNTIFGAYRVFTSAQNNYLEYPVLLAAGTWKVDFYSTRGTDRSIITISIDGSDVGTVDAYGSTQINTPYTLGSITIATSGIKLLRFTAATKNASSSGYIMMLYVVSMTRTGA